MNSKFEIARSDIWIADLGTNKGSIQSGIRPCVVISNDVCNKYSPTIHIVPITTANKPMPTHVNIPTDYGVDRNSVAICEQQMPINKVDLRFKVGRLSEELMQSIERALKIQLGMLEKTQTTNKSAFPPNLRHSEEYFDMSKARHLAKAANEWEDFINKNKHKGYILSDVEITINNYISELTMYCKKFNQNIDKFYKCRLDRMGCENGEFNRKVASYR